MREERLDGPCPVLYRRAMKKRTSPGITRREFHQLGSWALAAACLPAVARSARAEAGEKLVTDYPENAPVIEALQYVHETAKPGQQCDGCILYTAGSDGRGKCQVLPLGEVKATGWCLS